MKKIVKDTYFLIWLLLYFCQLDRSLQSKSTAPWLQLSKIFFNSIPKIPPPPSMAAAWVRRSLPYAGMVSAVVALAVNQITSKMAMSSGTSFYILSVYSNALAALLLFPTAYLFHRCAALFPFLDFCGFFFFGSSLILWIWVKFWFLAAGQSCPLYRSRCYGGFSFLLLLG